MHFAEFKKSIWAMVAHAFSPNTWEVEVEAEAGGSLILSPAWSTERVKERKERPQLPTR